ncbi:MAG: hypothetical protein ABGX68_02795 [Methylococcales bacterium]|jgi:hypothetical protein
MRLLKKARLIFSIVCIVTYKVLAILAWLLIDQPTLDGLSANHNEKYFNGEDMLGL